MEDRTKDTDNRTARPAVTPYLGQVFPSLCSARVSAPMEIRAGLQTSPQDLRSAQRAGSGDPRTTKAASARRARRSRPTSVMFFPLFVRRGSLTPTEIRAGLQTCSRPAVCTACGVGRPAHNKRNGRVAKLKVGKRKCRRWMIQSSERKTTDYRTARPAVAPSLGSGFPSLCSARVSIVRRGSLTPTETCAVSRPVQNPRSAQRAGLGDPRTTGGIKITRKSGDAAPDFRRTRRPVI